MKNLMQRLLILLWLLVISSQAWGGTWTANGFVYKPEVGARGAEAKALFDSGVDRIDARLGKEIWVGDPQYGSSLPEAIAAIGANSCILRVPAGTHTISDNLAIPANIALKVERGATLAIATTKTLTINGPLEAGLYQIFTCAGTGKVAFAFGAVKEVYPQWWGAKGDNSTDCTAAFQAAITAAGPCGGAVRVIDGTYKLTASLTKNPAYPCIFRVADRDTTILKMYGNYSIIKSSDPNTYSAQILDFSKLTLSSDGSATTAYAVDLTAMSFARVRDCKISNYAYGIKQVWGSFFGQIEGNYITTSQVGILETYAAGGPGGMNRGNCNYIKANIFRSQANAGILIEGGCNGHYIGYNDFEGLGVGGWAIKCAGSKNLIQGNNFECATDAAGAIYFYDDGDGVGGPNTVQGNSYGSPFTFDRVIDATAAGEQDIRDYPGAVSTATVPQGGTYRSGAGRVNLIHNGSFELPTYTPGAGWALANMPYQWRGYQLTAGDFALSVDTTNKANGRQSIKLNTGSTSSGCGIAQKVYVVPNKVYTLSAMVNYSAASKFRIAIGTSFAGTEITYLNLTQTQGVGAWMPVNLNFNSGANSFVWITIAHLNGSGAGPTLNLDSVCLTEGIMPRRWSPNPDDSFFSNILNNTALTGTTDETTVGSGFLLPAYFLDYLTSLDIEVNGVCTGTNATKTIRLYLDSTVLATVTVAAGTTNWRIKGTLAEIGAQNAQIFMGIGWNGSTPTLVRTTASKTTTGALLLKVTMQLGNSEDSAYHNGTFVRINAQPTYY
jgi:hypothetical protein